MARVAMCLLLVVAACTLNPVSARRWHPLSLLLPRDLAHDQVVQIWTHGTTLYWEKVAVTADSVSGVTWYATAAEPRCKKCRSSLLLSDVDSIRYDAGLTASSVAILVIAVVGITALTMDPNWK